MSRQRIFEVLDGDGGVSVTVLAAPPGYGKTTSMRDWCARRPGGLAWVTLDDGDNDPVMLWSYVATAVDRLRRGLGQPALRHLAAPGRGVDAAIDELANGMAAFGQEVVVVLDDFQCVRDRECRTSIDHLISRLPPNVRLVLITRADPMLELGQLRAHGALAELRADELAFSLGEALEFFAEHTTLALDADEVELLLERTEGWPAALFLAALWLRTVEDPHLAVRSFGGDHRFVAEYLSRGVIDSLGEDARSFLLRASVLGRFTPELCDSVFGRTDSAAMLGELERSNLFFTRLELGGWFRVHSLFAEFARARLESVEPGAALETHRQAAAWLRSRGLVVEAAEHAAAGDDFDFMAELLVESQLSLITTGRAGTLLRWVRMLPDRQLIERPELAVGAAVATSLLGAATLERRRFLGLARRAEVEHPEAFTPYVEAMATMVRAATVDGDVGQAVADGRRAVELARAGVDDVLVAALGGYARALYFAGDFDAAWAAAMEAVEYPEAERRPPGHALARATLALVAVDRGQLASARAHAERAKSIVGSVGSSRSQLGVNTAAAMGLLLAAEGKLAEAEHELAYAEHFFQDEVATVHHAWLLTVLAQVRCRRGRLDGADAALAAAEAEIAELDDVGRVRSLAAEVALAIDDTRARARGAVLDLPSDAEFAVLRLLSTDLSVREIAAELYLSPHTVRSHTRALYRKLEVNSRAGAVGRAEALHLVAGANSLR